MTSHLESARPLISRRARPRRVLAAAVLAIVVALGVSVSIPAGPASAAPGVAYSAAVAGSTTGSSDAVPPAASDRAVTSHVISVPAFIVDLVREGARTPAQAADDVCGTANLGRMCRLDVTILIQQFSARCSSLVARIPQMKVLQCTR
ncbi:hypothetical protein [Clavibacter capsici]|uniref:Uncharacterized protein n=1 Tax=Clavibacter capsici TaxID=1874630 RepID=A0AAE7CC70_9MICO|nr:hypothetical protein [Clavibacter capsici]QIS45433.1 hypothetical protein GW570_10220 [Clavibacter capsici]